ncbi:MAG: hypothetical protein ACRELC_05630 [Gemmatimonadota bacterium]
MSGRRFTSIVRKLPLLGCSALIVYLGWQNRTLTDQYTTLRDWARSPHAGYAVPTFRTATLDGDSVVVGEAVAGHRQFLFVFDTRCPG